MSGLTTAIQQSANTRAYEKIKNAVPSIYNNDSKVEQNEAPRTVVDKLAETSGGEVVSNLHGSVDSKFSLETRRNSGFPKEEEVAKKCGGSGSSSSSAAAKQQPQLQPSAHVESSSAPRQLPEDTSVNEKAIDSAVAAAAADLAVHTGDTLFFATFAATPPLTSTAAPASPMTAKSGKKEEEQQTRSTKPSCRGNNAKSQCGGVNDGASPSNCGRASTTNNNSPLTTGSGKNTPGGNVTAVESTESRTETGETKSAHAKSKQQLLDHNTPVAAASSQVAQSNKTTSQQQQSNKDKGNLKNPASPSKKKKKKKNKKKRKSSNSDNKFAEPPDHNRNANSDVPQESAKEKPAEQESSPPANKKSEPKPSTSVVTKKNGDKKVADPSQGAMVATPSATDTPYKFVVAQSASVPKSEPTLLVKVKRGNEKSEKSNLINDMPEKTTGSKEQAEKDSPGMPSIDVLSKTFSEGAVKSTKTKELSAEAEETPEDTKLDPNDGPPAESSTLSSREKDMTSQEKYSKKKDFAQENQTTNNGDETDDGAWETVEVKPRGRRSKGGCGGGGASAKKSGQVGQGSKTPNGVNSISNNCGRNHGDHGNHDGRNHEGGNHHGNSSHGRKRNRKHYRTRNQTSQNTQQCGNNGNQQQHNNSQSKVVKDVIYQILDAVDDQVAHRRDGIENGKQGVPRLPDDGKRQSNNNRNTGQQQGGQRGRQSNDAGVAGRGLGATLTPPSMVSNSSAKSLRDILVGSSSPTLPGAPTAPAAPAATNTRMKNSSTSKAQQAKAWNNAAASSMVNNSQNKGRTELVPKGLSSKVKPGMSYKSMVEPDKLPELKPQLPKPKHNAWAKPSAKIKAHIHKASKLELEKASAEQSATSAAAAAAEKPLEEKPNVRSTVQSIGLVTVDKAADKAVDDTASAAWDESRDKSTAASAVDKEETALGMESQRSISVAMNVDNTKEEEDIEDEEANSSHTPSPPLSTLLTTAPGGLTSCSASSSVASSLEAPHASNRFRQLSGHQGMGSGGSNGEDDVGYHLLNVCGQLSEEIRAFMSRRALALDVRRRERSAVLNALGEMLGKIWPGQCRVEMYGSCATQLDLPSSDLDLVVCGLDNVVVDHIIPVCNDDETAQIASLHANAEDGAGEIVQEYAGQQPMSPDHQHQHLGDSMTSSFQEGEMPSTPNQNASSVAVGDTNMMLDECPSVMMAGMEPYSPAVGSANVKDYSPDYLESSNQELAEENFDMEIENKFSPGVYSYHSQHDVASYHSAQQRRDAVGDYHTPGSYQDYQGTLSSAGAGVSGEQYYYATYSYLPALSPNAQRVLRLASELELQPWAVQVKAIPTATVPVVKMLADPSRLPGLSGLASRGGGDRNGWMQMQQRMTALQVPPPSMTPDQLPIQNQDYFSPAGHPMAQWRGTDIKNGLQPVDITFEGPEHGGIGSTTYSARVVQDACDATGLLPEGTPLVQVASVLKELLAQRRLNEPFSGGLSSYGLLLLLLAVLKDRKIIREEMERVERQRKMVSSDDGEGEPSLLQKQQHQSDPGSGTSRKINALASSLSLLTSSSGGHLAPSPGVDSSDKGSASSKPTVSSSWASIAKKSNGGSTALTESLSTITKSTNDSGTTLTAKTGGANYNQVWCKEGKGSKKDDVGWGGKEQTPTKKQKDITHKKNEDCHGQMPEAAEIFAVDKKTLPPQSSNVALDGPAVLSQVTPSSEDDAGSNRISSSSVVPQGSNDVFEVLCSGKLTSGKLLMHFLLFYGQHFDAQSTLVDVNGTHHPEYGVALMDPSDLSPFVARPRGGTIDPITGMYSVDPIVVYDPLEGAADHNVSKRCYCWNNVRWVFAQCYMTVSSVVESSDRACSLAVKGSSSSHQSSKQHDDDGMGKSSSSDSDMDVKPGGDDRYNKDDQQLQQQGPLPSSPGGPDVAAPILELLLSF